MDKIIIGIFATIAAAIAICFAVLAGSLFGALGGWLVDLIFGGRIAQTLTVYGLPYVELWKVGATLGFLSGVLPKLFRSSTNVTTNS